MAVLFDEFFVFCVHCAHWESAFWVALVIGVAVFTVIVFAVVFVGGAVRGAFFFLIIVGVWFSWQRLARYALLLDLPRQWFPGLPHGLWLTLLDGISSKYCWLNFLHAVISFAFRWFRIPKKRWSICHLPRHFELLTRSSVEIDLLCSAFLLSL